MKLPFGKDLVSYDVQKASCLSPYCSREACSEVGRC